jgi:hypothetical protein
MPHATPTQRVPLSWRVSHTVKLRVKLIELLFECPPEVLNRVKVWRIWWPVNCVDAVNP